ncbi:hypothetical protein IKH79_00570 [Candidatus Saccharibacteria bacterium]|nr:hypothetical protein [Candidatus Saccharibacteria bacterium]
MSNEVCSAVKQDEQPVDMKVVEAVVRLSKHAEDVGKQLESALAELKADEQSEIQKFIRKQLAATEDDGQTRHVQVLDSYGFADLIIEKPAEHPFVQVKCNYPCGVIGVIGVIVETIDWQTCKDKETLYINRAHPNFHRLREEAIAHGIKNVIPTGASAPQCEELAKFMIWESEITGKPDAVFFPHAYSKEQAVKLVKNRGVLMAEALARIGGAVAVSREFGEAIKGEKSIEEVAKAIADSIAEKSLLEYAGSAVIAASAVTSAPTPVPTYSIHSGGISSPIPPWIWGKIICPIPPTSLPWIRKLFGSTNQ